MTILKIWYHITCFIDKILLKIMYGNKFKIGKSTTWRRGFSIMIDSGALVDIGNNCFFNNNCSIAAMKLVRIGDGTLFGENVKIYDHNHRFGIKTIPIKNQGFITEPVVIGKHCWIGSNVTILKGAIIEDYCVIGAGTVIDTVIKSGTIVKKKNDYDIFEIKD